MKEGKITIQYYIANINEVNSSEKELFEKAVEAAKRAYAPYSNFKVGAAILLSNGKIVTGSNQENAAYPSGLCAERVAMFSANHQYPDVAPQIILLVAIDKDNKLVDFVSPCGSCRQVLSESEKRYQHPIKVILCGKDDFIIFNRISDLLPFDFKGI